MCLCAENPSTTSSYDIICYKILISVGSELRTPYRDFLFSIGELIEDVAKEKVQNMFGVIMVESGFFHSYKSLEMAKKKVLELKRQLPKGQSLKIYKAIIPANVVYYEGQLEDICSKSLKIIEECCD